MVWKCDNCDTVNDESLEQCAVCDQPRPTKIAVEQVEESCIQEEPRYKEEGTDILDEGISPCEESVSISEDTSSGSKEESSFTESDRRVLKYLAIGAVVFIVAGAVMPRLLSIIHIIMFIISVLAVILSVCWKDTETLWGAVGTMFLSFISVSYLCILGKIKNSSEMVEKALAYFRFISSFWFVATLVCLASAFFVYVSESKEKKAYLLSIMLLVIFSIISCLCGIGLTKLFS